MTTKEFIKAVEELGYETEKDKEGITIRDKNISLACVFTNETYRINSNFYGTDWDEKGGVLFALIFQYACTPVEDREEEKRFYLRHKWLRNNDFNYLCFDENYQNYTLSTCYSREWKMQFTAKEIEKLKEKFNTNLEDFEMVEVEE